MPIRQITNHLISRAESRLGVALDYTHKIAETDFGLLMRYNRIFPFLDPVKHVPPLAYHAARLRGAIAADCGTCVAAEINLAKAAGLEKKQIEALIVADYAALPQPVAAVALLADAVTGQREDDPANREEVRQAYGEAGLIELSFAMNGAALLPGIKRAMGYAVACDVEIARQLAKAS